MNIFADTIAAMPDEAWALGRGPKPDPCRPVRPPQTPAGEVQADEPGPASADGEPSSPVAGPGDALDPAPGAPLDGTEPAIPPAGGEPSAEALGAGQDGSEGEAAPGDVVTPAEVEAEFGPARTESEACQ